MTIEAVGSLSSGMERYPKTFTPMQVQQIRIGERTGALEKALARVCDTLDRQIALRKRIVKKISYPSLVTLVGVGLMIFMCVVVAEFKSVYASSGVELPTITRIVTSSSRISLSWGWTVIPAIAVMASARVAARSRPKLARRIDSFLCIFP